MTHAISYRASGRRGFTVISESQLADALLRDLGREFERESTAALDGLLGGSLDPLRFSCTYARLCLVLGWKEAYQRTLALARTELGDRGEARGE